jgi:hypothetical protein
MSKALKLAALLTAENSKRVAAKVPALTDVKALEAGILFDAIEARLIEQENAEINAIAAAYRGLDDAAKAAVRHAAGV